MIELVFPTDLFGGGGPEDDVCYCGCWCPAGAEPKDDDSTDDKDDEIAGGIT